MIIMRPHVKHMWAWIIR